METKAKKEDCPFKSPKELGLTLKERDALIKTLLLMEAGKMVHIKDVGDNTVQSGEYGFSMREWHMQHFCGTVCCIGGTAELLGGLPTHSLAIKSTGMASVGDNLDLYNLFYRWGGGSPSPERAAQVLRGYLTTGKTKW